MDINTFANKIKQKYPQYHSMDNARLVESILKKYPQYQSQVTQTMRPAPSLAPREVFSEMGQDIKQTWQGVKEGVNKRLDTVNEIQNSDASGVRKATQIFGQGLGSFQDVLGQGFKGIAKVMLAPEQEQQVKNGVGNVVGKIVQTKPVQSLIEGYAKLEQTNPKAARDVDTAVNTLMTIIDVASVGSASTIKKVGQEAIQQGLKATGKGVKATGRAITSPVRAIGDVVGDAVPSLDRVVNSTATKAINLTAGDVKNIAKSTGNEPGQWLGKNNLIKNTAEETSQAIKAKGDEAYTAVRDEINKVTKEYSKVDVPRYEQALKQILKQVNEVPGLEATQSEVSNLLKKEMVTMVDIQRSKELLDEVFSLYKATGDVQESTAKEGLANVRKEIKEFIENEVKKETGVDIKPLNNDVATARSLEDAISTRSTRGLTRSNIGLGDLGAFGAGSLAGGPVGGAIAVIVKKIVQSPAVGLRFARWLDKLSDAKKAKLRAELEAGNIPDEVEKILGDLPNKNADK